MATSEPPRWAREAAAALYERMREIDGRAMDAGQREQDPEADRWQWTDDVAQIIWAEFLAFYRSGTARGQKP